MVLLKTKENRCIDGAADKLSNAAYLLLFISASNGIPQP